MKTLFASLLLFSLSFNLSAQNIDTVRIAFIGDVMAHVKQLELAHSSDSTYYFSSYFKHIKPKFDSADLVVANMEFSCGVKPYSGYPEFSAPPELPLEAQKSGVGLFLTANNHICDKGKKGVDSTYSIYKRMGINFTGIYPSAEDEEHNNPLMLDVGGIRIAFINFTYSINGHSAPEPFKVNMLDSVHVKEVILRAKERGAEFIVALPHWGEEYHLDISKEQTLWKELLYRCGVDAIIGTHPHVVQKTEYDTLHATAYSLGNYISNMSIAYGQIGMLYELRIFREDDWSITILPPKIEYLWCARGGKLEDNYTVIPILEYIEKRDEFVDKSQYDKMIREWNAIKKKFDLKL